MRKILFRGKEKVDGYWVFGWFTRVAGWDATCEIRPMYSADGEMVEVDHTTVGQYTGINDKTGCHIYEGDIIRAVLPETVACREFVWPLMAVAYHEGAFGVWQNARDFTPLRSFASRVEFTIVGNIHDNPELMEDE